MKDGYFVEILRSPDRFGDMIRIARVVGGAIFVVQPMELIFKPHKPGDAAPIAIKLPYDGNHLLDAFKDALNEHHGIREGHAEGELKATKAHLRDMKVILYDQLGIKDPADDPQIMIKKY